MKWLILLAALAALLAACSSGDDATPTPLRTSGSGTATAAVSGSPTLTDVCSLFTRQEATAALGANVTDRAYSEPITQPVGSGLTAFVSTCAYSAETTGAFVKIDMWEAPGQPDKMRQLTQTSCSTRTAVDGVGDVACWLNGSMRELYLSKGAVYLDISSSTLQGDPLKSVATTALSRLP